ncbi:hypothetical protein DSO57_1001150 [Entomophthora muscae]|uniref:Uncharacterized protein n=1 Tax=Entomophthora muscae TaxID=34485 RepID=A0ACC2S0B7_9FUNG|nr:hypothetical protein DSO57_1001150 [Entomophthora muscae]
MVPPITNCQKKSHAKAKQTQNQPMDAQDSNQMDIQEAPSFSQATALSEMAPQRQISLVKAPTGDETTI